MNQSCFRQIDSSAVCIRAYTRGPTQTHAYPPVPVFTHLWLVPQTVWCQPHIRLLSGWRQVVLPILYGFSRVIWRFSMVIWLFSKVICWIVCVGGWGGWGGLGLISMSNLNRVRLSCCWVGLWQFGNDFSSEEQWIKSRLSFWFRKQNLHFSIW